MKAWRRAIRGASVFMLVCGLFAAASTAHAQTTSGDAALGATLYSNNCSGCHGTPVGSLRPAIKNAANAGALINEVMGNMMGGYTTGSFTSVQENNIAAYISQQISESSPSGVAVPHNSGGTLINMINISANTQYGPITKGIFSSGGARGSATFSTSGSTIRATYVPDTGQCGTDTVFYRGASATNVLKTNARSFGVDIADPALPVISSAGTKAGTVGVALSYTITTTGGTPGSYAAVSYPTGLSRSSNVISGTPTVAGTYNATVYAYNCFNGNTAGQSDSQAVTFTIAKGNPNLTLSTQSPSSQLFRPNVTFAVNPIATSLSPVAITYTVSPAAVCTISGTTITKVGVGTCAIVAHQITDANWLADDSVTRNVTITQATQALVFPSQIPGSYSFAANSTFSIDPVTSSGGSGNPVIYSSLIAGVCTVSGTTATMVNAGTCTLVANQAGNTNYSAASQVTQDVTLAAGVPGAPTATAAIGGDTRATVLFTAPANPGSPITSFTATCINGALTRIGAGAVSPVVVTALTNVAGWTCSVTATNAIGTGGASNSVGVSPTPSTTATAPVIRSSSSATFTIGTAGSFLVVATGYPNPTITRSGIALPAGVLFTNGALAGTAIMSGTPGLGTAVASPYVFTFTATNASGGFPQTFNLTIAKAAQSITFSAPADRVFSPATFGLTATSSSGLAVSYASSTTPVCTVSTGGLVTMVGVGTCSITANQAGDSNNTAATPVPQSFQISQASQSITWGTPPAQTFVASGTFTLSPLASASSSLPVSYVSLAPAVCSIIGTTITMLAAGTCTLEASQDGDANYGAATNVQRSFAINKASQTITFGAQTSPRAYSAAGTFAISPVATGGASGNPIVYSSTTASVCSVAGATVTMVSAGVCTIAANQAGDANYNAATQVTRSVTINAIVPGAPTIDLATPSDSQIKLDFTAPVDTGGSPIIDYRATCNPGNISVGATASPAIVTGLTNNLAYNCSISASNAAGGGASSATIMATPFLETGVNTWNNLCSGCHGATPAGVRFNAAGQTGTVIDYVRSVQPTMLANGLVQGLTLNELAEVAKYIETFVPAISANTAFNTAVGVDVSSHLTLGTVSFTAASVVTPPANGMLSAFSGTQITYTPNAGFVGMDTFTYRGSRSSPVVNGDPHTVTITVVAPPAPVITSPAIASGTFNSPFAYQITATNSPTSYAASPLGANFTINTMTGLVSGTPMVTGTFMVTVSATNAGGTGMQVVAITISKANQTITFGAASPAARQYGPGAMFAISPTATATSMLAVNYSSLTPAVCTVSGSNFTTLRVGTCTIAANQAGNANYNAALEVTQNISITAGVPTAPTSVNGSPGVSSAAISFNPPTDDGGTAIVSYTATCTPSAMASNTVSPITLTMLTNGQQYTCSVTASNGTFTSPASASVMVTPTAANVAPSITSGNAATFDVLASGTFTITATGNPAPALSAMGTLPSGVTFNPGTGALAGIPATGTANTYPLTFTATNVAGSVMQSFTLTVAKLNQTITFANPGTQSYSASPIMLTASASSMLPLTIVSNTNSVCTVSGTSLTMITVGTCSITASQAGNANYNAAGDVTQGFNVNQATQTIAFPIQGTLNRNFVAGSPFAISPTATASSSLAVIYSSTTTGICSVVGTTVTMVAPGTCTIAANQSGSAEFLPATPVTRSVSLNATAPGAPTIGAATPGNGQATIAFTPPANNGGSAITGYTATCNPGGFTGVNTASPIAVSGLTNGVNHTCSVTATNGIGTSVASGTVLVTPLSGQGATLWTQVCDVCHTSVPSGTQLNGAGTTATVINFVRSNQTLMAMNSAVQALTLTDLADIATYISANVPPNDVVATLNTPVMVNVNNHITLTGQPWSAFTTIEVVTGPANGTLGTFSGTQIQYTPTNGYLGSDSFIYRGKRTGGIAYDGDPQTVNITVNPPAPAITSSTSATGTFGVAFNYPITATNTPTSFDATGLPGGLGVSTITGAITGTPTATGSFTVALSASNAGGTGGATLMLQIDPAPQAINFPAQTTPTRSWSASGTFAIAPTATGGASNNPIIYGSLSTGVCTVSGTTVTIVTAGSCVISADQTGNNNYAAAPQVTRSVTINAVAPAAPVIGPATAGNAQASIAFTPPSINGGSAITSYTATCNPAAITGTAASSPITVTGLTNGVVYTCSVTATNAAAMTSVASGTVMVTPVSLMFTGLVQSRKAHGVTDHNITIVPNVITGPVTVEPRGIGSGHRIVFTFNNPVTSVNSVSAIDAMSSLIGMASAAFLNNELTVTLTGVPDNMRVTVVVTGANGSVDASASLGFLVGDVSGAGSVNASDISAVKANLGLPVGAGNFRMDIDAGGTINQADVSSVKARSGLVLP